MNSDRILPPYRSLSAIAREYGLNWRTVKREIEAGGVRRAYPERAKPTELTASQLEHLARRLVVHPGIWGTVLYREVADDYGYNGSYTSFVRHLRELRPLEIRDPEIRFETDAACRRRATGRCWGSTRSRARWSSSMHSWRSWAAAVARP